VKVCRETFNKNHLVNNRLDKAFIDERSEESHAFNTLHNTDSSAPPQNDITTQSLRPEGISRLC
jgi:hypothetical protein